jgi:hypothetical protein
VVRDRVCRYHDFYDRLLRCHLLLDGMIVMNCNRLRDTGDLLLSIVVGPVLIPWMLWDILFGNWPGRSGS